MDNKEQKTAPRWYYHDKHEPRLCLDGQKPKGAGWSERPAQAKSAPSTEDSSPNN